MVFVNILKSILEDGFVYAILALGVYISYSILDFPDLSVDGTMPLGAVITGVLILKGVNPWLGCAVSFLAGVGAGTVTGILNVKLKIRPLLCGILTMTALLSINLVICLSGTDGASIVSFFTKPTIFSAYPAAFLPQRIGGVNARDLIVVFLLVVVCKLLLDLYLKTKSGLLLRAAGNNEQYAVLLARDPGRSKILGLAIGNGFAALSGAVIAQGKGSADLNMGTGMVVLGLASVIIGLSVFKKVTFINATTKVILGSILYKACLQIALTIGLPTNYLKLLMAALFTVALVLSGRLGGDKARAKGRMLKC